MPGYNIVGIDCDGGNSNIIALSGAIHCITHSVGVEDPLMISHLPLNDTDKRNTLLRVWSQKSATVQASPQPTCRGPLLRTDHGTKCP